MNDRYDKLVALFGMVVVWAGVVLAASMLIRMGG